MRSLIDDRAIPIESHLQFGLIDCIGEILINLKVSLIYLFISLISDHPNLNSIKLSLAILGCV